MKTPFLRTPYNYDTNEAGNESAFHNTEPTLAKQSFKEECDINTIVNRFGLTGHLPTNVRMPTYGDFTAITDYRDAIHALHEADEAFAQMPSRTRARFENNPALFVEFCNNPANREEAITLGLVVPPQPQTPPETPAPATAAPQPKTQT